MEEDYDRGVKNSSHKAASYTDAMRPQTHTPTRVSLQTIVWFKYSINQRLLIQWAQSQVEAMH
jgi:hypothetical protein